MHWLIYSQAVSALSLSGWALQGLRIWFIVMIFAPGIAGLLGERTGICSAVTYFWFGLVFYLFLSSLMLLLFKLVGGRTLARPAFILLLVVSVGTCAWGAYQALRITVREVTVTTTKPGLAGREIRLALISDVHFHSVETESRLERILKVLETMDYDLLISSGDLIEAGIHQDDWQGLARRLAEVKPPLGKLAVIGNHEVYADRAAGTDISDQFHAAAGFDLLLDQTRLVDGVLQVVGLVDSDHGRADDGLVADLLDKMDDRLPVLLLKHKPVPPPQAVGRFDLMLSGHTHNGQMWPFNYVVKVFFPYLTGLFDLGQGSRLYTTPGTGTWGPPIRVGTRPEITLIRLKDAD
jgi:hypothetical protein